MRRTPALASIAASLVALGACVQTARLEPAPTATPAPGAEEAAVDRVDGVEVMTGVEPWPGDQEVLLNVTAVWVEIDNGSDESLQVRYDHFALVAADGRRYSALPPFQIEGTVDHDPFTSPGFTHHRFHLAPHHSPFFPGLLVYDPFVYDPLSYDAYHPFWDEVPLPTRGMLERAIPEGVLDPGGDLSGYLYFEPVDPEEGPVTFRATLSEVGGERFGEVSIPYRVTTGGR